MRPVIRILCKNFLDGDFLGDPGVENPPFKAGDSGLISDGGSKIPYVAQCGQKKMSNSQKRVELWSLGLGSTEGI